MDILWITIGIVVFLASLAVTYATGHQQGRLAEREEIADRLAEALGEE